MTTTLTNLKQIGLFVITASSLLLIAKPSQSVTFNLSPSDFTNSSDTVDTNASNTGGINKTAIPNGFGDFFSSNYLLLGASGTDSDISAGPNFGNHSAVTSDTFSINSVGAANPVSVRFDWAFQGSVTTSADEFVITLSNTTNSTDYPVFNQESPAYRSNYGEVATVNNLTPGEYNLYIDLNEAKGSGNSALRNTAAGFDNISVEAVPFEFSPAQGLLAVGSLWGVSAFIKRRKAMTSDLDLA
jgi:hypothetical protein